MKYKRGIENVVTFIIIEGKKERTVLQEEEVGLKQIASSANKIERFRKRNKHK